MKLRTSFFLPDVYSQTHNTTWFFLDENYKPRLDLPIFVTKDMALKWIEENGHEVIEDEESDD